MHEGAYGKRPRSVGLATNIAMKRKSMHYIVKMLHQAHMHAPDHTHLKKCIATRFKLDVIIFQTLCETSGNLALHSLPVYGHGAQLHHSVQNSLFFPSFACAAIS